MKTRHSKYIFTLCTHSEVRTTLLRFILIPISLHTHILTRHVLLYYVWKKAGASVVWLSYSLKLIGHTHFRTSNGDFKLVEALLEIHSIFFSHSIITRAFPLSAVTAALHYLPRCLSSRLTCGKTPTTLTSSEQEQRAFYYRNTISKKSTHCYCSSYLGITCSTIEFGKIVSYYLLKLKSVNSIWPVGKWRDTNPSWKNLDWKTTVDYLHWKWLHFQLVILNWRGIQQPNTEIDFELSSNNWIISCYLGSHQTNTFLWKFLLLKVFCNKICTWVLSKFIWGSENIQKIE